MLLFFGPILLPKALAYYRSIRASPTVQGVSVRPVPPNVSRALAILFVTALVFFFKTLPYYSPENIFSLTQSRIQIPTDVLFTRLAALRPTGLTTGDETLRGRLNSLESRLLFFQYGPEVIRDCTFCTSEDPKSYLYYALPAILAPHLFNLCVLALVTSGLFTGKEGSEWRTTATIAAAGIALGEIYMVSTYAYQDNARATRPEDLNYFHWRMRVYRCMAIAAVDGIIGWLLYLSSTNRAFVKPPTTAERLESTTRVIEGMRSKLTAMGILRNTVSRDEDLRSRSQAYWLHEGRLMGELMEEREVVEGVNNALESRINMAAISADAENYAENVVGPLRMSPGMGNGSA